MQDDYEARLEAVVRRELEALPDLSAPPGLAKRVLLNMESQMAPVPWYRRSWPTWPAALRVGSAFVLAAVLGAICLGVMQALQTGSLAAASQSIGDALGRFGVVARTVEVLISSLKLVFGNVGSMFVALWLLLGVIGYALCFGVGTYCYQLAFVSHETGRDL